MRPRTGSIRDRYSRYEVRNAESRAWAGEMIEGHAEYFFDGMCFWRHGKRGKNRVLASWQAPSHGWWHRPDCTCGLCQGQTLSEGGLSPS